MWILAHGVLMSEPQNGSLTASAWYRMSRSQTLKGTVWFRGGYPEPEDAGESAGLGRGGPVDCGF